MSIKIPLFKNKYKEEGSNQPDYKFTDKETGNSVAGWIRQDKAGSNYVYLEFKTGEENAADKAKYQQGQQGYQNPQQNPAHNQNAMAPQQQQQHNNPAVDDFDDESIPF